MENKEYLKVDVYITHDAGVEYILLRYEDGNTFIRFYDEGSLVQSWNKDKVIKVDYIHD